MQPSKISSVNDPKTQDFSSKNRLQVGFKLSTGFLVKCFLATLLSYGACLPALEAQVITVYPTEHPQAVTNPGIGYRGLYQNSSSVSSRNNYSTLVKHYVPWGSMETSATEDITGVVSAGNTNWALAPGKNIKITPRAFLHYYLPVDGGNSPAHFQPLDYSSETTRNNVLRVIRKLGKVWDRDPRILSVETGILGAWGEQQQYLPHWADYDRTQHPRLVTSSSPNAVSGLMANNLVGAEKVRWEKILSDAFREAFPNKPLLVREMASFSRRGNDNPFSTYWDLFASPGQYNGTFQEMQNFGDRPNLMVNNNIPPKRYLLSPMLGEIDWERYDPSISANHSNELLMVGSSGRELTDNDGYSTRFANYVRTTHLSAINGMGVENIPSDNLNLQKILKAIGYRFHISEFSMSKRVEPGATFTVNAKIKNLGSAPIYQNYPVAFFLLNKQTDTKPAFMSIINDVDIRMWHPGSDFDWEPKSNPTGTQVYLNPAVDNVINASITIPATLAKGDYFAGIAILEPSTGKPAVYFAIPNFFEASQAQPLCRIGVGQDPLNTSLTGVTFDVMNSDTDSRDYDIDYYKTLPEVKVEVIRTGMITGPSAVTREPAGSVQIKFTRQASDPSHPLKTDKPLKVTFETGGTATNGVDYQSLPTSVIIPTGSTSVTMNLNVINDTTMERGGETMEVNLTSNQLDYYLTGAKQATVTINDDTDFDMATLGNVELLGSWVQGNSNPVMPGANRALVVLPTAVHLKGATDTSTPLRVSSVSYGGRPMRMVTENSFVQGSTGHFAYSGAFVLGETEIALATSDVLSVTWQTPDGAVEPKSGSNIASAFFSNVKQAVSGGFPVTTNPMKSSAPGSDTSGRLTFVGDFQNEAGDYIITAGRVQSEEGVYRVDRGFTSFTRLLPDFTYEFDSSGAFYGLKVGSGVAERPTFNFTKQERKSMVGFVLKKIGPSSGPNYTLTTAGIDGAVTLNPPGGTYTAGTVVTVTAEPDSDFTFSNWSEGFTGSVNPRTITMDGNKSVTAIFARIPTYTLTATWENGSVSLSPPGGTYQQGTVVTVTATPGNGYSFANWSEGLSGAVNDRTIIMDGNKSVKANFVQNVAFTGPTGWVSGTSNPKVSGENRLMTVMVMGESSGDFSATSVTYGGQTMIKRSQRLFSVTGNRTYAAMFTLGETGVRAATTGNIAVTWSTSPSVGSAVYSVLLAGVDQANPVSASVPEGPGLSGTSISTTPLFAGVGDLVIMCGATETNTDITYNNGFIEGFESNTSWGDATGGLKVGVGANETPSFTQAASGRMVLCAMVVRRAVSKFSLVTTANNGRINLSPVGEPGGIYDEGTVVTVTAIPDPGFAFANWGVGLTGSVNPTSITMSANQSVIAYFGSVGPKTWDGGGANSNWSTVDNWSDNFAPFGPTAMPYAFAGNTKNTSNNDLSGLVASDFNFTNSGTVGNTSPFVLSGNLITLGVGRSVVTSTVTTGPAITDMINLDLRQIGSTIFNTGSFHNLTINGNISETAASAITKNGAGILTLSGNNTYTGATFLQAGTISLSSIADGGSGSNIGSGNSIRIGNLGDAATLNYTGNGSTTARTVQIGNGAGIGGAIILATGPSGGTGLKFTAPTFNTLDPDGATNARSLTLSGSNTDDNTISGIMQNAKTSGVLNLVKEGNGKWILSGVNTYTGNTTVSGGTLQLSGSGKLGSVGGSYAGTLAIASGATFQQGAAGGQTLSGVVGTGGGNLSMAGSGDLILSNVANAYGALNISAGRVFIANTGALPTAATVALAGGSLNFNATGTYNNAITVSSGSNIAARVATSLSNVTLPGSGSVTFNNDDAATSTLAITKNQTLSGTLSIEIGGGNATVGTATLSGIISGGSGAITKMGTGTLTLSGANTYTGATNVSAGTLQISATGRLANGNYPGALGIASGASFQYGGSGAQTLSGVVGTGGGTLSKVGAADLILSNGANAYGALNISAGRVFINTNAGALPSAATVALSGGSLVLGRGATYNSSIIVSSGANIAARGGATLSNVTLPDSGSVVFNNDNDPTVGLTITKNQTLSGTLSIQVGGGNAAVGTATLSGIMSGASGAITKTGVGTLTLTGANTYTGNTTVSGGTLAMGASNVLPATAVSIGSATLDAATFTDTLGTLDVTGSAIIKLGAGAALTFSDSRAIDWSGGTLTITGTFVSGSSLRIGTSRSGLTPTQLSQISKPGGGAVTLNDSGFLIALPATSYTSWASTNASGTTSAQDKDNDGVPNAVEYVLGGDVLTNDLSKLPVISSSGENVLFTFKRTQASINATTALRIQVGTTLHTWPDSYTVGADTATSSAGVAVVKDVPAGFDTVTLSVPKVPVLQKFIRLNVNITP